MALGRLLQGQAYPFRHLLEVAADGQVMQPVLEVVRGGGQLPATGQARVLQQQLEAAHGELLQAAGQAHAIQHLLEVGRWAGSHIPDGVADGELLQAAEQAHALQRLLAVGTRQVSPCRPPGRLTHSTICLT